MASFQHNPVGAPRPTGGELLPKGRYLAIITDSRVDDTKQRDGKIIWLERTIQEPASYRGRKVFQRLNVRNKSQEAERIGQEQLNQLLDAIGLGDKVMTDTVQLHGRPHLVDIKVDVDSSGKYDDQNEVRRALPVSAGGIGTAPGTVATAPAANVPFHQRPAAVQSQPAQQAQQPAQASQEQAGGEQQAPAQHEPQQPAQQPASPALSGGAPPWLRR